MRILVADDEPANRELLTELLRTGGHTVITVSGGREVLEALAKDTYEVVLMDEEMPGMGGLQATREILQKTPQGAARPIIIGISGNSTKEDEERCLAAGMDAFFAKPIRSAELFGVLAVLARKQLALSAPSNPTISETPADDLPAHLNRVSGGDEKIIRSLLKTFLADTPKRISAIRRALSRRDAPSLAITAHLLKGSLGLIGAPKAAGTARNLQAMGRLGNLDGAAAEFRVLKNEFDKLRRELLALQPTLKSASKSKPASKSKNKPKRKSKPRRSRSKH